jgi:hypothetical protein
MGYRETFLVSQDGFPPALVPGIMGGFIRTGSVGFIEHYH